MRAGDPIRIKGLHFLSELYSLCGEDTSKEYNIYEIGRGCGCNVVETKRITKELFTLDLVRNNRGYDEVSITPKGIALIKGKVTV